MPWITTRRLAVVDVLARFRRSGLPPAGSCIEKKRTIKSYLSAKPPLAHIGIGRSREGDGQR